MSATFKCDGSPYENLDEAIEEHGDHTAGMKAFMEEECGEELDVPGSTGMGHVGVVSSDFWCDECGKHYTASQAKAKARRQERER